MDDGSGWIAALFALVALVLVIALATNKNPERRTACEAKGGIYLTGRNVTPLCIKKDSIIPMAP